jgi:hypothetical protein
LSPVSLSSPDPPDDVLGKHVLASFGSPSFALLSSVTVTWPVRAE